MYGGSPIFMWEIYTIHNWKFITGICIDKTNHKTDFGNFGLGSARNLLAQQFFLFGCQSNKFYLPSGQFIGTDDI